MITQNYGLVYPSCEILVNGQKRKLYGKNKNKVYLNNGDEFQLKVYNPLNERVGFQLKMNGVQTDNALLVINPGQNAIIERFIGTNNKLKFLTYVVDKNNPQTKKAIKDNGILEVTFYYEQKDITWDHYVAPITFPIQPVIYPTYPSIPIPIATPVYPPYNPFHTWYMCDDNINFSTNNGTSNGSTFATTTNTTNNLSGNVTLTGDVQIKGNLNVDGDIKQKRTRLSETGRIEKGNRSNQYFSQTEFKAGLVIRTFVFKLLPFSEKKNEKQTPVQTVVNPVNPYIIQQPVSYVRSEFREYCPNKRCNYRIRKGNWGFCPVCGTKLD